MILEKAVTRANEFIKYNKKYFKNYKRFWIVFDKEHTPFLGCEKNEYDFFEGNQMVFYDIYFYNLLNLSNEKLTKPDTNISFDCCIKNPNKPSSLTNIFVSKNYSGHNLGSEILKILQLVAYNNCNNKIVGNYSPYDYARNNHKLVKHFYEKNGFKFSYSKLSDFYIKITKEIDQEEINNLKHRVILYPTKNQDFYVILPKSLVLSSSYYDDFNLQSYTNKNLEKEKQL